MASKDSDTQTNLPLFKVGRSGRVAIAGENDEHNKDAAAYKRLMAKMQEEARPVGYLFGRGALDHDDVQYLKEQGQAEEDALRQRELNERRAFAAFKAAASASDSAVLGGTASAAPAPVTSPRVKVEAKQKSGIRQSALLQRFVSVKPKKQKLEGIPVDTSGTEKNTNLQLCGEASRSQLEMHKVGGEREDGIEAGRHEPCSGASFKGHTSPSSQQEGAGVLTGLPNQGPGSDESENVGSRAGFLLGLAYADSDEETNGG